MPARRARSGGYRQRQHAERKRQRRHHNRAEPELRRLNCRLGIRKPFLHFHHRKFDNQNCVFRRQPDKRYQSDLKIEVVFNPAHPHRQQRPEHRKRHREDNHNRQRPFLVLRRQNEENHNQPEHKRLRRRSARLFFLIRRTDPRQSIIAAQHFRRDFFHRRNRLSGRISRRRVAHYLRRRKDVETVDQLRPRNALYLNQRRQRHQCPGSRLDVHIAQVVRRTAEFVFRLQRNAEVSAHIGKVVDIQAPERGLHHRIDVVNRHVKHFRLLAVKVNAILRRADRKRRLDVRQFRAFVRRVGKFLRFRHQLRRSLACLVLDIALKPAGRAHAHNRRHAERIGDALVLAHADARILKRQLRRRLPCALPQAPVFERNKADARISVLAGRKHIVAVNRQKILHVRVFPHRRADFFGKLFGARQRRRLRQRIRHQQIPQIFRRHQPRRHDFKQRRNAEQYRRKPGNRPPPVRQKVMHSRQIPARRLVKKGVKPPKERRRFLPALFLLDNQRAQCRRQRQSHQCGNQHRYRNRYRKLLVHNPGHAAQKRNRQKYRRQHQRHRDHRPRHFLHRLNRRLFRRQPFFVHQALDVFQHDNRVVNHDTDCQNQPEQRQKVNRKAQQIHSGKRADNRHRHRQNRNQRRPHILQKQVHNRNNQQHRFKKRMDNFFNRHVHEQRRVVRDFVGNPLRKALGQFRHFLLDQIRRFQRVRPRLQINRKRHRRLAVKGGGYAVVLRPEFNPRHVLEPQHSADIVALEDDIAEFFLVNQPPLGIDRIGIGLRFRHRLLPELPRRKLRVLFLHRRNHVLRRQVIFRQFVGRQPDAHRIVLRRKQRRAAHALDAPDFVQHVQQRIVGNIHRIIQVRRRTHRDNLQNGI